MLRKKLWVMGLALALSVASSWASITIALEGESVYSAMGYSVGEKVTFLFVVEGDFLSTTNNASEVVWNNGEIGRPERLWESIAISGMTGDYVPSISQDNLLNAFTSGFALLTYTVDDAEGLGLVAPNGEELTSLYFSLPSATGFTGSATPVTVDEYFANYFGSLDVTDATVEMNGPSGQVQIVNLTSATIAVPEPGTWALLGCGGIGVLCVGRKRRRVV